MATISDWRALPFDELWVVDTEFYPGPGLANGGRNGDAATPLCLVALEMRTGRIIRRWQDEFGPFPPYRLDADACIMGYMISAEFGSHIALGWGRPACALDPYIEFRHHVNNGAAKAEDREKGFFSLDGALRYFGENGIDTAHKTDIRSSYSRHRKRSTQRFMTSSISFFSATSRRSHASFAHLWSWKCIHRFRPRRFLSLLPTPKPTRARSTWRRRAPGRRPTWPANCSR